MRLELNQIERKEFAMTLDCELLDQLRSEIRSGFLNEAERILAAPGALDWPAAVRLNLLGVIYLARGDERSAQRCFTKSYREDPHYSPAEQNLRRMYELKTLGRTRECVAMGDETPALDQLLQARSGGAGGLQ
jgi:hypothetical protein